MNARSATSQTTSSGYADARWSDAIETQQTFVESPCLRFDHYHVRSSARRRRSGIDGLL